MKYIFASLDGANDFGLSCLMTMCLPIETGCSKFVEELRIASFKIAKDTDNFDHFYGRGDIF